VNPNLHELSIDEVGRLLRARQISAPELAQHHLDQIAAKDQQIRAFVQVDPDLTLAAARHADNELRAGLDRGPLHGIPYGLKDIIDAQGYRTTCQSKVQPGQTLTVDSAVAAKMRAAGAILLGKLNTWEFALDGPAFDLPFPPARNPWNLTRDPGGSSSGCGAAIAAGFARIAIGTDTGGSIRYPASACGVVGIKPTRGRVSLEGVFPLSATLDHCGPLGKTVRDVELCLEAIAEPSPHATGRRLPSDGRLEGIRVGLDSRALEAASADETAALHRAAQILADRRARVERIDFPDYPLFNASGLTILFAEAFHVHQHTLRSRPRDYGELVYRRLLMGGTFAASELLDAYRVRSELTARVSSVMSQYDAVLTATTLTTALPLEPGVENTILRTIQFDVTGHPAVAVPCGTAAGLPLSVQLAGRYYEEGVLLGLAKVIESV